MIVWSALWETLNVSSHKNNNCCCHSHNHHQAMIRHHFEKKRFSSSSWHAYHLNIFILLLLLSFERLPVLLKNNTLENQMRKVCHRRLPSRDTRETSQTTRQTKTPWMQGSKWYSMMHGSRKYTFLWIIKRRSLRIRECSSRFSRASATRQVDHLQIESCSFRYCFVCVFLGHFSWRIGKPHGTVERIKRRKETHFPLWQQNNIEFKAWNCSQKGKRNVWMRGIEAEARKKDMCQSKTIQKRRRESRVPHFHAKRLKERRL